MIGAIVLAAGLGRRFASAAQAGSDESKVLAEVRGRALVRHVVERLELASVGAIMVVAGTHRTAVSDVLSDTTAMVVHNPRPEEGLAGSLRIGIDAAPAGCDALLIALGDQPFIDPAVVRRLVATWESCNAAAVVPRYRDAEWGHPILMDATLRNRLGALEGDAGARGLLVSLGDRVARVEVDADAPGDVDRREDLDRMRG